MQAPGAGAKSQAGKRRAQLEQIGPFVAIVSGKNRVSSGDAARKVEQKTPQRGVTPGVSSVCALFIQRIRQTLEA